MSIDYSRVCFVIMPFGIKKVGLQDVDFDFIYREVFRFDGHSSRSALAPERRRGKVWTSCFARRRTPSGKNDGRTRWTRIAQH